MEVMLYILSFSEKAIYSRWLRWIFGDRGEGLQVFSVKHPSLRGSIPRYEVYLIETSTDHFVAEL
jgi:hypothetical protein